jgi:hypothetical protein
MKPDLEREPEKRPEIMPPGLPSIPERATPPEIFPQKSPEIYPEREHSESPGTPTVPTPDSPEIRPPEISPR